MRSKTNSTTGYLYIVNVLKCCLSFCSSTKLQSCFVLGSSVAVFVCSYLFIVWPVILIFCITSSYIWMCSLNYVNRFGCIVLFVCVLKKWKNVILMTIYLVKTETIIMINNSYTLHYNINNMFDTLTYSN